MGEEERSQFKPCVFNRAELFLCSLWEKKKDLIRSLVRCVGVERSLFLYNKTEALELSGGLLTLQVGSLLSKYTFAASIECPLDGGN